MKEFTMRIWRQIGTYKYVLLVIAAGLLLLIWPNAPPKESVSSESTLPTQTDTLAIQLEKTLRATAGVGRVQVLLTIKQDMETQYLQDANSRDKRQWTSGAATNYEQEVDATAVLRQDEKGGEEPLVKTRLYPIYQGAIIVCDGANDNSTKARIIESVAAVTNLGFDKISVIPMQQPKTTNSSKGQTAPKEEPR